MENFINKIKTKDGQEYDVQDKRVDSLTSGTKLYKHQLTVDTQYISNKSVVVINTSSTSFTTYTDIFDVANAFSDALIIKKGENYHIPLYYASDNAADEHPVLSPNYSGSSGTSFTVDGIIADEVIEL